MEVAILRFGKAEKATTKMQVTGMDEAKTHERDQGFDGGGQGMQPDAFVGMGKVDVSSPMWLRANGNTGLIA